MKQTRDIIDARDERPSERERSNVISFDDYRKRQTPDSFKQEFRNSLSNDQVMQRYNIQQPTLEERAERIRQSIARINAMIKEAGDQ